MAEIITLIFYTLLMVITAYTLPRAIKYKRNKKKRKYYLMFFGIIILLSLVSAFRGSTGTDSLMYSENYTNQYFRNSYRSFEWGFILLFKILHFFKIPYQGMFFIVSFVQNYFVFKSIEHEADYINVKLAAFIYIPTLYLNSFNGMRQMVTVGICIYAILLYLDNKKIKSVVLVLLSAQLHRVSYVVLFVIFAKIVYDLKSKFVTYTTFAIMLFFVFNRNLLNEIYHLFTGQYTGYLSLVNEGEGSVVGYLIKMSVLLVVSIVEFGSYKERPRYYTVFGMFIIGIMLKMLEYFTHTQVGRVGYYFSYLEIVLFPYIVEYRRTYKRKRLLSRQLLAILITAYYYVIFLYNFGYKNFSQLVPYSGFFGN